MIVARFRELNRQFFPSERASRESNVRYVHASGQRTATKGTDNASVYIATVLFVRPLRLVNLCIHNCYLARVTRDRAIPVYDLGERHRASGMRRANDDTVDEAPPLKVHQCFIRSE